MRIDAGPAGEIAQVETITAAGVQNNVAGAQGDDLRDAAPQRLRHAAIVQSPPRFDRCDCVARLLRSPFLRLQQVDVPAARHVERMPARTNHPPLHALKRHVAVADWAEEHGPIVSGRGIQPRAASARQSKSQVQK